MSAKIDRIVLIKNAVETLGYFSGQIAAGLKEQGFETYFIDYEALDETVPYLSCFARRGKTALLTFNFIGLSGEPFFKEDGHEIWETYEMQCLNILVDHPLYYHTKLAKLSEERRNHAVSTDEDKMTLVCIDRDHAAYIRRFYPEIHVVFMPLAGNRLFDWEELLPIEKSFSIEKTLSTEEPLPLEEREYDLVFTGNHVTVEEIERRVDAADAEYRTFYREIMEDVLTHPKRRIEAVMEEHIRNELGDVPEAELCSAMAGTAFVDIWARAKSRAQIVERLADADIKMLVVGEGWDYLKEKKGHPAVTGKMVDSAACVSATRQGKLSLNVLPWFQNGAHDRIFTAMLQKSVALTDGNDYLRELFGDKKELVFYSLDAIEELPQLVRELLNHPKQLQEIADCGYACAKKFHIWEKRARFLADLLK